MKGVALFLVCGLLASFGRATMFRPVPLRYVAERNAIGAAAHEGEAVVVRGVATVASDVFSADYYLFYIQDSSAGVAVFSKMRTLPIVVRGDVVHVTGTVRTHDGRIEVDAQSVKVIGREQRPRAIEIEPEDVKNPSLQGRLVKVRGRVHATAMRRGLLVALVAPNRTAVSVYISKRQRKAFEPLLREGVLVDVTGIASQFDPEAPYRSGWRIRPRVPGDIKMVPAPSITAQRLIVLACIAAGVLGSNLIWIIILRRRIRKATASLVDTIVILRAQQEATIDGILITDRHGHVNYANQRFKEIWRLTDKEMQDATVDQICSRIRGLVARPEELFCDATIGLALGESAKALPDATLIDGRIIAVTVAPMRMDDGSVRGAVWTFRDVTEREILRGELDRTHRVAGLGRLAASIAHEINNVLMAIQPQAELLRRTNLPPATAAAGRILAAVQRGKRTTAEVLSLTRPVDLLLDHIPVISFMNDLASEIRSSVQQGVELVVEFPDSDICVHADREQLAQVFINLAVNANHAMPHGGRLRLSARRSERSVYSFGVIPAEREYVHFEVADTGSGIAPDLINHIFEPLFTTKKNGGSGLGLAISQQIVTAHHGLIFVESRLGMATTFHFFIPMGIKSVVPDQPGHAVSNIEKCRLLIVEDDDAVAEGLQMLLAEEGAVVRRVECGWEVMPALEEFNPDAILLDIDLPDTSGEAVYHEIIATYPDMAVIFSSGHMAATDLRQKLAGRRVNFLDKPYEAALMVESIASLTQPVRSSAA